MRPLRAVPCVLVLACAFPAVSLADDFTDYRIPAHRASAVAFSFFGTGGHHSEDLSSFTSRNTDWNGQGSGQASWLWDSDPREWDVTVRGNGASYAQHFTSNEYSFPAPGFSLADDESQRATGAYESWSVSGGVRLYPGIGLLALDLRGTLNGQDAQQWTTSSSAQQDVGPGFDQRTETQVHQQRWNYQEFATVDASVGWGRVRDATPVFQAILLEERLDRDHALARPLSHEGRQRLAELFSLRGSYSLVHNLPDKFFWADVERVLREDGALAEGGLQARPLRHADDPLVVARGFSRSTGFFVGPVLSGRHGHFVDRLDQANGSRLFSDGNPVSESITRGGSRFAFHFEQTYYGAKAEYHRPLGVRTQIDASERALVDLRGDPNALQVSGNLALSRLIAERWFFSAAFTHYRELQNRFATRGQWNIKVEGTLAWYLEDYLQLGLRVADAQSHQHPVQFLDFVPPPGIPLDFEVSKDFQASLGLTFAWGQLSARDLGVNERSMR